MDMFKKIFGLILPLFIISALILAACNFPLLGGNSISEEQAQTLAAGTIQAEVGMFLTQTAQVNQVIVITATPLPGSGALPTATLPAATAIFPTSIPPTATPIPIPCNQAGWVTDVTVPDGSSFVAGVSFVKTWRVKNIGSCTWGTGYSIMFLSGNSMSAPATVALPTSVRPGETVDISVPMVAPSGNGDYTGSWMLRAANGTSFGVGASGGVPVTVKITVTTIPTTIPTPKDPNTIYDFVGNYCSAQWRTNAGAISCPSSSVNYSTGAIMRSYAPIIENGTTDDEGTIISVPAAGGDGMIQGQFPNLLIHSGDRFEATALCSYQKTNCSVTFEVLAQEQGSSTITSLGTWNKTYDNTTVPIDIDLSAYDGKNMIFYLKVSSGGNSTDDYAQWMAARITHN
jgi:hypothetical protein